MIPAPLLARWRNSKLLFLGYSLRDWNLRVILRRLHRSRRLPIHSWAVLLNPENAEEQFWSRNNVEILNSPLADFIEGLTAELQGRRLNG
ncbi:MAG: SIR2 family protein [Acidobacteriia bacterium]|nr:SIR2 family protein [Terriglobia bacterium]